MNTPRFLSLAASGLLSLVAFSAPALTASADPSVDDVITKARTFVGSEDKLTGLTTIQYFGDMYDGTGAKVGTILMQFKKPGSQRSEFNTGNGTEIEATDGFEGWALKIDKDGRKGMAIIMAPNLANYINTSYENLFFFRGPLQRRGGTVELVGSADFHGAHCWQVTFNYPSGLMFTRFFDQTTGELRGTITDNGDTEIIESGKTIASGITFPSRIDSFSKGKLVRTMKFNEIFVNQPLDDTLFAVPDVSILQPAPGTPAAAAAAGASVPTAPVASGVAGFSSPPPANTPPPASAAPASGSPNQINVPPATPTPAEQPLMFNIKPTTANTTTN